MVGVCFLTILENFHQKHLYKAKSKHWFSAHKQLNLLVLKSVKKHEQEIDQENDTSWTQQLAGDVNNLKSVRKLKIGHESESRCRDSSLANNYTL